ncbi:hypothetical protein KY285_000999 [Solanum tuberosum]|nr:hypothetical protein KY285_000999 [Solanum tuberosum]
MSKKMVVTPRKIPRLVEGTSTDEVQAPSFNILTQTPSPKFVETPARGGSSLLKDQKEKKNEVKKRMSPVRVKLKELKDNVDKHTTDLKAYADNSTKLIIDEIRSSRDQPTQTAQQEDDAHQHVEESEKAPMDQPSVSMRKYVDISNTDAEAQNSIDQIVGRVFNADIPGSSASKPPTLDDYPDLTMIQIIELDPILNANTTLDVQPRNRKPRKYDTSPYIRLSEGESSLRRVTISFRIKHPFESYNGFEVEAELIDEFNKWVFKDASSRRGRKFAYSKLKDIFVPQMDFGVVKVSEKDFFNIMIKPGRSWEDGNAKYSPIPLSYSTVDCWFMTWVDNIEKQWRESNCDMRSISPNHDVGQCIRGFKLLANIPWDSVDDVIIPVNIIMVLHSVDIDAKYHCQRYATILRHYGKIKNEDGAISESEVTGTVARKFGGTRLAKEHVPNTTNYPTPRP